MARTKKGPGRQKEVTFKERKHKIRIQKDKRPAIPTEQWSISEPVGGRILEIDPAFSADERYFFVANARAVHVFSTITSLLVRSFKIPGTSPISGYKLSAVDSNHLYISCASGLIILWNWITSDEIGRWETGASIDFLAVSRSRELSDDAVYTLHVSEAGPTKYSTITAHVFQKGADATNTSPSVLLRLSEQIDNFRVIADGTSIVVVQPGKFLFGQRQNVPKSQEGGLRYVWRELKVPRTITCIATRHKPVSGPNTQADNIDIAVGTSRGEIFVYEDIVKKLVAAEKGKGGQSNSTAPRIFHWHRDAVNAVAWSLDGNYVLSGGQESVLCLWQLVTGKRQELPHLISPITSIVVSPTGTSYAVRLADNSVMVLSTAELAPKANIAWTQSQTITVDPSEPYIMSTREIPASLNPRQPSELLLAVPTTQSSTGSYRVPAPYMQTFDVSKARHISRQAITRNNATSFMTGPDQVPLLEPDVTHLKLSFNGKWLATAEEWQPPQKDLDHVAVNDELAAEQIARCEVYMKFWLWNEESQQWMLEARIDAPHQIPGSSVSGRVFDLTAHPHRIAFSSLGEDGLLKTWEPTTKLENGTFLRGDRHNQGVVTWACRNTVKIDAMPEAEEADFEMDVQSRPLFGCLAYSPDGSVLAATHTSQWNEVRDLVHLIDASSGQVHLSRVSPSQSKITHMGFLQRSMVVLSESVVMWDVVTDEIRYCIPLSPADTSFFARRSFVRLAVNSADDTFAISTTNHDRNNEGIITSSTVTIFRPTFSGPIFQSSDLPNLVLTLLPSHNSPGFVILDAAAEIRLLSPPAGANIPLARPFASAAQSLATLPDIESEPATISQEAMDVDEDEDLDDDQYEDEDASDIMDNDKPVVRPHQLAAVFESAPSHALPPMRDLFNAVVDLYARKTEPL